jgi:hypothetical protein
VALTRGDDARLRAATTVGDQVNRRGDAAPGAIERLTILLGVRFL